MSDAFISYRRKPSASLALLLQEKLKNQHGIAAYVDTTRTDSTRVQFPERLMGAIADAPVFICLLADSTLDSEWVRKEIQQAHRLSKHCVPVFQESYIAPVVSDPAIDYLLKFDGVHVFDQKNVFVDEAVAQIAALTARPRRIPWILLVAIGLAIAVGLAALYGFGNGSDGSPTASQTSVSELPAASPTTNALTTQPGQSMTATTESSPTEVASLEALAPPDDQFSAHVQSAVTSLAFSPDGSIIYSGGIDGTVRLWNAQTRASINTLVPEGAGIFVEDIALSPDAALVAAALNKGPIHVWDVESQSIRTTFDGDGQINSVDFNTDGTILASAGNDGSVRLWDIASGTQQHILEGHSGQVLSLAFSHNTNQLISGDSDGTIIVWDVASASQAIEFQIDGAVLDVDFAPDDTTVMAAGGFGDHMVHLWTLEGGSPSETTLIGHIDQVRDAEFRPDGQILASVSRDQTVRLWAIPSGTLLATWEHENPYWSLAFSPDGQRLIVGDESGFIQLWELKVE